MQGELPGIRTPLSSAQRRKLAASTACIIALAQARLLDTPVSSTDASHLGGLSRTCCDFRQRVVADGACGHPYLDELSALADVIDEHAAQLATGRDAKHATGDGAKFATNDTLRNEAMLLATALRVYALADGGGAHAGT